MYDSIASHSVVPLVLTLERNLPFRDNGGVDIHMNFHTDPHIPSEIEFPRIINKTYVFCA